MAFKLFKVDNFHYGTHQEFFIDSQDDLEQIEEQYDCELGDKAYTPDGTVYIRHSDEFNGDLWDVEQTESTGGSSLPAVTSSDNGDVLTVVDGAWDKAGLYDAVLGLNYDYGTGTWTLSVDAGSFAACEAKALAKVPVFIALYVFNTSQSTSHGIDWFFPIIRYNDYVSEGEPTEIWINVHALMQDVELIWYSDDTYKITAS